MQRLLDLQQYVADISLLPRLSHEEARHLTSRLAAVQQGALSPELAAQAKRAQVQRLEAAYAELVAQSIPICVRTLAGTSHVDKKVIGPFVHLWDQQGACRQQSCCQLLEELPPCREAKAAFSGQNQTSPPCKSFPAGTAERGIQAPAHPAQPGAFLRALRAGEANPDLP